jgi:hypothetical protein
MVETRARTICSKARSYGAGARYHQLAHPASKPLGGCWWAAASAFVVRRSGPPAARVPVSPMPSIQRELGRVRRPRGAGFRALPSGSVTEARDTGLWAFPTKEFKLLVFQLVGRNEKLLDLLAHLLGQVAHPCRLSPGASRAAPQSAGRCGWPFSLSRSVGLPARQWSYT